MSAYATAFDSWDFALESDRSFRRITARIAIPFLILALVVPFWQISGLQEGGGDTTETLYVTLAPEAEQAAQAEEPKPEKEDTPEPEKKKEAPAEKPQPTQEQLQQKARAVAQKSGVLAMADQLAALRDDATLAGFDENRTLTTDILAAKSGTGASGGSSALAAQAFADAAVKESGGISSPTGSSASRRAQSGTGLDSRRTTVVQSPIGFGKDKTKPGQDGDKLLAGRTIEEIQQVFDRNKGAFNVIVTRAMRENANIGAGKIVVSLTIAPNGTVTDCKMVSSSYNDPAFEAKIIAKVKQLNFGPKDVPSFTYPNYPINILPT